MTENLVIVRVGDKAHEPDVKEIEKVAEIVRKEVPDKEFLVVPYWVDVRLLGENKIEELNLENVDMEQLQKEIQGLMAEKEVNIK